MFSDVISTKRMSTTGTDHLVQCLSLTDSVSKSERAAEAMRIVRIEILRVDRRGSVTVIGKWRTASRLLRYRYAPDWNRPTDWSRIHALKKFARPATHIIWIICPRTSVVPPPLILAVMRPRMTMEITMRNDPMYWKTRMF